MPEDGGSPFRGGCELLTGATASEKGAKSWSLGGWQPLYGVYLGYFGEALEKGD